MTNSSRPPSGGLSGSGLKKSTGPEHLELERGMPSRRFLPEPLETVKMTNRGGGSESKSSGATGSAVSCGRLHIGPRKFAPQLIETVTRSFRKGRTAHNTHSVSHLGYSIQTSRSANLIDSHSCYTHVSSESRFSYSSLLQRRESRRHSFRVPDLPAIPSNSSEGSDASKVPSLSTSPSASSDECIKRPGVENRGRESCDKKFSGYLLSLAARSAERQLKEQTLAAFPNEQVYQPVAHFAIDREDENSGEEDISQCERKDELAAFRRESSADLSWELEYMRQHKVEAERRQRAMVGSAGPRLSSPEEPAHSSNFIGGWQREVGLTQMRYAASPPMLGNDLVFPQSLSPEGTLYDDGNTTVHNQRKQERACSDCGGLWYAEPHVDGNCGGGLWMGTCRKVTRRDRTCQEISLTEIMVPDGYVEEKSKVSLDAVGTGKNAGHVPSFFLDGDNRANDIDRRRTPQEEMDREFHDGFVTQIYNYLSLGYPCVARYYDHELSKVSGIPLEELRRDDLHTDAKGYVVVAEGAVRSTCMRWVALRLYIHEWARQQPTISGRNNNLESWGVRERRGSWAI